MLSLSTFGQKGLNANNNDQEIKPYTKNQWYWQYKGEPIVLRGASDDDNPFQWTGKELTNQLDLLASVGGNYLRNTMSDRDEGNVYAFKKIDNDKYDLNEWNEEYWNRLTFFLDETSKKGIIVQLTLWDYFDINNSSRWGKHPWNPKNNINMESDKWKNHHDFYSTIDRDAKDELAYQQKFIDHLLTITLSFDNVIYNINNESSESGGWENHWAFTIKDAAKNAGKEAFVTNMQLSPSNAVRHVMSHRDIFDFVDISQINQDSKGARGSAHWDYLMYLREKISASHPIPMNNVKIYGSGIGSNYSAGSETEAVDRFWRTIFGGCASARFHRPAVPRAWGSGLNERVQANLKAMDMLLEKLDIVSCVPHNDLLSPSFSIPSIMEAYATANIGHQYAVYFPQGRYKVNLDPWVFTHKLKLQWLDINNLEWSEPEIIDVKWEGSQRDWGIANLLPSKLQEIVSAWHF